MSAICFADHSPIADSAETGGNAIIRNRLPKIMKGNAETTPSRIARKCFCSDNLAMGVDKLFSKKATNFSIHCFPL
jgi:hypothetical protein